MRAVLLGLLLCGCATTSADRDPQALAALAGSWSGRLVPTSPMGLQTALPAALLVDGAVDEGAVVFVSGGSRATVDQASVADGRVRFRAPQFRISRTTHRTLRCDLGGDATRLAGTCRAGQATYNLTLARSGTVGPTLQAP